MVTDKDDLAPLHRNLAPVPEHTHDGACDHRGAAMDYGGKVIASRCSRCGEVAHKMWNLSTSPRRREFRCMEATCGMRWWESRGRMGLL